MKTTFYTPVQDLILQVEDLMRKQAHGQNRDLETALDHLLSSGGKRVRPAVALLTGGMLGGDPRKLVILAAAIEMLHTATLVHDDLIDGSLLRRGMPTLNAHWSPAATVLTGDFIFSQAARLAAETESLPAMKLFAETLATIVNGEITQLFANGGIVSHEDYYRRIHAKTASLFELAAHAAAILSPVGEEKIWAASRYGHEIGMAFQVIDDILDFTGEQETVGKPVASDLRQGIITLPVIYYSENHPNDTNLTAILEKQFNETVVSRLLTDIRESGAINQAMDEARQFIGRGLEALSTMPTCVERQALEDLAQYIIQRHL